MASRLHCARIPHTYVLSLASDRRDASDEISLVTGKRQTRYDLSLAGDIRISLWMLTLMCYCMCTRMCYKHTYTDTCMYTYTYVHTFTWKHVYKDGR